MTSAPGQPSPPEGGHRRNGRVRGMDGGGRAYKGGGRGGAGKGARGGGQGGRVGGAGEAAPTRAPGRGGGRGFRAAARIGSTLALEHRHTAQKRFPRICQHISDPNRSIQFLETPLHPIYPHQIRPNTETKLIGY